MERKRVEKNGRREKRGGNEGKKERRALRNGYDVVDFLYLHNACC